MLKKPFRPEHGQNKMRHEGDVVAARQYFFESKNENLKFLIRNRFEWMNKYINPAGSGMEVGCGIGVSKLYIKAKSFLLTDFDNNDWLDVKNVDALHTPFPDQSFDFVVSSNMIHHVPYPKKFFNEMGRILKPGGVLLIQEINASFFMRLILRIMKHEGYDFSAKVFDENFICTDPQDLWSANCVIPNLLFDDAVKFEQEIPQFKIERSTFSEFFVFADSGGVVAKTFYVPLPVVILNILKNIDNLLASAMPSVFALQRQIVLKKVS